jgi:hypothetical protein
MHALGAVLVTLVASLVNLSSPSHYVHWWIVQISVANLLVIVLMVLVFLAAILIPFKGHRSKEGSGR